MSAHPGELLSAYVDGELDTARRKVLEDHLATCAECRAEIDRIRRISSAVSASEDIDEVTAKRFLAENRRRRATSVARSATSGAERKGDSHLIDALPLFFALAALFIVSIGIFVALGGPLRNMFSGAVGTGTMGQNQAALSGGIY